VFLGYMVINFAFCALIIVLPLAYAAVRGAT